MAETLAAWLYRFEGYRIVARRYRSPSARSTSWPRRAKRLAFVEVKRRKTQDEAALAVTAKQKRRIVRAAQYWLASHPDFVGHSMAFDVVLCGGLGSAAPRRESVSRLGVREGAAAALEKDTLSAQVPRQLSSFGPQT